MRFETYRNPRGGLNCQGRVYYVGPLGRGGSPPRIKLDLAADEEIFRPPSARCAARALPGRPSWSSFALRAAIDSAWTWPMTAASGGSSRTRSAAHWVEVTGQGFVPCYVVELSPTGLGIPPTTRGGGGPAWGSFPGGVRRRQRTVSPKGGPTYVIQSTVCGRKFERTKHGQQLRPHKTPQGWDCPGRTGFLAEMKYEAAWPRLGAESEKPDGGWAEGMTHHECVQCIIGGFPLAMMPVGMSHLGELRDVR